MNLLSVFDQTVRDWPAKTAVFHRGQSFSYAEIGQAEESLARELRQLGIEEGHKVGVMFPSGVEHIIATFAVLRLGGIVCYVLPASKAQEIAELTREVGLDAFCCATGYAQIVPEMSECEQRVTLIPGKAPLHIKRFVNRTSLEERDRLRRVGAAHIRFSSGTTGKAKGIIVSHDTILERAKTHHEAPYFSKQDTMLWLHPMARVPGPLAYLLYGAKVVIGDGLDVASVTQLIQQHSVTHVYSVPMFYKAILNEPSVAPEPLGLVRHFLSGGTALGRQTADSFAERFDREIVEHYGLAEGGTIFINLGTERSKRGSIGVPVRAEVRLLSHGEGAPEGDEVGELLVRGPGLFDAYYKPWRLRDEVMENGWFRTGDLARRDCDGYYWIVGRTKEVINVGGVSVFPREIEEVLLSHPDVEEALVFGVSEPRFGEVPHGKIKLRLGAASAEKDLLRWVNEKLSVFKALRKLEVVDEIPKTATGKLRRDSPERLP